MYSQKVSCIVPVGKKATKEKDRPSMIALTSQACCTLQSAENADE